VNSADHRCFIFLLIPINASRHLKRSRIDSYMPSHHISTAIASEPRQLNHQVRFLLMVTV